MKNLFSLLAIFVLIQSCTTAPVNPKVTPVTVVTPPTAPAPSKNNTGSLNVMATSCAKYFFKNRGFPPAGYVKGMSLMYARSYCRFRTPDLATGVMGKDNGDDSHDALTHYGLTGKNELDRLKKVYTLLFGLGMRESTGSYMDGTDTTAGPETPAEAETGLLQFSYNLMGASPALKALYEEYRAHPEACLVEVFKEGAQPGGGHLVGTSGPAYDFQVFVRKCPALAAEFAAVGVRLKRGHWGPLTRKEVEYKPACEDMFTLVEQSLSCK